MIRRQPRRLARFGLASLVIAASLSKPLEVCAQEIPEQGCAAAVPASRFVSQPAQPCSVLAAAPVSARPSAAPVDTLRQLWPALTACWRPPAGSEGSEITLRFSLTHKGALRGLPMVTYSKLTGSLETQKAFALAAIAALTDCTPVALTDHFGRIASQRMLHIRFINEPKRISI